RSAQRASDRHADAGLSAARMAREVRSVRATYHPHSLPGAGYTRTGSPLRPSPPDRAGHAPRATGPRPREAGGVASDTMTARYRPRAGGRMGKAEPQLRREDGAFLAAIHAHPRDDAPRLSYADWLAAHGDSDQAEFIRLQVELERVPA